MSVKRILRGGTRNQSTADFHRENLFLSGNRYYDCEVEYSHPTETDPVTLEPGVLLKPSDADPAVLQPIVEEDYLGKIVGISNHGGEAELFPTQQGGESVQSNICVCGDIDAGLLVLPEGVDLDTEVDLGEFSVSLRYALTRLGFHVNEVTENSKFDN